MDLNILWFILLGVLMTGYAILDGFDLGVGMLHFVARGDRERRIMLNSIGPLWDGNEVWLVTFGGALFAAFPDAYATTFSAFYIPFHLLLFALIFRAVSLEFRSKRESAAWRGTWDAAFCASSTLAPLLFGVAVGNAVIGLPIGADREFAGSLLGMLRPYPLVMGLLSVSLFAMHGAIYLYLKTEGDLQERIHGWMWKTFGAFLVLYVITTVFTLAAVPNATSNFRNTSLLWIAPIINVLTIANIAFAIHRRRAAYAFLSSCLNIAALNVLFAAALFPNILVSSIDPAHNLNIYNAASSQTTLTIMTIIAIIGMPLVLIYTAIIYWTFRGKVEMGKFSY
jgi:cytochrome bd ubiquinol oxidase subunit II